MCICSINLEVLKMLIPILIHDLRRQLQRSINPLDCSFIAAAVLGRGISAVTRCSLTVYMMH